MLRQRDANDPEREALEGVRHEVKRIDNTVRALLDRARPRMLNIEPKSLTEVTWRAVNLATGQAAVRAERAGQISITFVPSTDPIIAPIDAAQIEDAILNLIINAIEASEGESRVTVRVFQSESDDDVTDLRDEATIEVSDQGSGISEEDLSRIFHQFFTTRKTCVDIRSFKESSGASRLSMIWCGSTEVFHRPAAVHATVKRAEMEEFNSHITPLEVARYLGPL